ncbi:YihY/virulence factor BrkB family protein [Luteolibacter sp. LG18]|uniref:YihY/virulence factor BrkB family protein n=1 Tax=Luteolibacter sp. LG18 TaxID=2819286 RepID=UPI002B2E79AE|nr:hypothetical protein llg_19810 [Luteolibacter sp. LG18]
MNPIPVIVACRSIARLWERHRHTDNAAALAFYSLVSLAPLLLFGVSAAGVVLGEKAAHGELERQLNAVIGPDATGMVEGMLQTARIAPRSQPLAFAVAMVTLLYAGSHVLTKLRLSLNLVNEAAPADPARRWLGKLLARGLCASLILLFGVLLVAGSAMEGLAGYVTSHVDSPWVAKFNLQQESRWFTTYLLLTFAFTLVLKILPRRRPLWRHAFVGAAFGALAAVTLKGLLDLYLRHTLWASLIGSGLTVLLFLFWLFFTIQAFLAGAELAAWLGRRAGKISQAQETPLP